MNNLLSVRARRQRNRFFSQFSSYSSQQSKHLESRYERLKILLAKNKLDKFVKHAGKYAGRRPSLHIETGLLKRVNKYGLGKYVEQFGKFTTEQFSEQLDKAERLMTTDVRFHGSQRKLSEAAFRVSEACLFPREKFVPTTIRHAAEYQINKRSSAGFPFYRRKGLVMKHLIRQARTILSNPIRWEWPQTRGFRIQLRLDKGKVIPKIRVMYPYPGCFILLEDTFIIPFVNHFINTDTFYVIGRNGRQIRNLLIKKLGKAKRILSSDVSSFDQNMLNEVIIAAFGILRCQLRLTKDQAITFENMVSYFCSSLMVSKVKGKQAYGFIKTHGVPSGSGFTNMIDTIAHAVILEYLEPGIIERCLICGDDNICALKHENVEHLFKGYEVIFNLPISRDKSDVYTSPKRISFLGFTWKKFTRLVEPKLVINQLLWHTDFLTELDIYERELARAASVLLNGANGKDLFSRLFPDVIKQLASGVDVRFTYLFGYQPPTTLPSVVSYTKLRGPEPNTNQSLKRHLRFGWLIR